VFDCQRGQRFLSSSKYLDQLWGSPNFLSTQPEHEAHLAPSIKALKPSDYIPPALTSKNSTFYPHIYMFSVVLGTNSDYFYVQRSLLGFYNEDEACLLHGTDWILK